LFARWTGKPKKEQTMSALLPVVLLSAAHRALPAGEVPNLNTMPGCQVAAKGTVGQNRDLNACLRNEYQARLKLRQQWNWFSAAERKRCLDLSRLGGAPSYVELLTCLQIARDAKLVRGTGLPLGSGLSESAQGFLTGGVA
jgi:hypothetical protein